MVWTNDGDMTPKERIHAAYRFEEVDRVPVFTRHEAIGRRALGISLEDWARDGELSAKAQIAMTDLLGDDCIMAYIDTGVEADGFGQRTVFQREEMPFADTDSFVIETADDYYKLEPYDVEAAPRIKETLKKVDVLVAERGESHSIVGEPVEPFVTLGYLRGMERLLADCIKHPDAVKHALEVVTDVEIAYVRALAARGCDVINLCWDYGNPSIMSEKMWLALEGDCMRRLYQAMRDTGAWVSTHMCAPRPYVDLALEIGNTDTIQNWGMPKGCANWAQFKEKYGRTWSITGGWNPVELNTLSYEEVKAKSKEFIRVLGEGGGYVLSLACEYPYNGPIINGKAMVDAAKEMAARLA